MSILPTSLKVIISPLCKLSSLVLFVVLSFALFLLPGEVFSQAPACYTFQGEQSLCIPPGQPGNLCQIGDQYYCPGHSTIPTAGSHPNHDCWICGSGPTQEKVTCSERSDLSNVSDGSGGVKTCGELGYAFPYENGPTCGDPGGVVQCVSVYSDGCRSCAVPQCPVGTQPAYDTCVAPITCSATATATGTTTGQANTTIGSNQDPIGYTTAEWRLVNTNDVSSQIVGYTTIDSSGNSSNNFTNLQPSTNYRVEATYRDPDGPRPDVQCSPDDFTTFNSAQGSTPTAMSCQLSASPQTINKGGSISWSINNSQPQNTSTWRAWWKGTDNESAISPTLVSGYTNSLDWSDTYVYNNAGEYTRFVEIKSGTSSGGELLCTTSTMAVSVNNPSCTLTVSPSSVTVGMGTQGVQVIAQGNKGGVTWTSLDSSKARVSPTTGNSTTISPASPGQTTVTATENNNCKYNVGVTVTSLSGNLCPGACADSNGNQLNPSQCSGTWSYTAGGGTNKQWDTSCNQQKNASFGYYCYVCDTGPGGGPVPTTPPGPPPPFSTGSIYVKGPLLIGKILQDFNKSFTIDALDTVIDRVTSIVTGMVQTVNNSRLTITGRALNIIRGDPVYNMCTKSGKCGSFCTADDRAVQQAVIFPGEASLCTGKVYNPPASVSLSATSDFIKVPNETTCDTSGGCEHKTGTSGSFTQTTTSAPNPVDGFSSKLGQKHDYRPGYNNSLTDEHTDAFSYVPGDVGPGSCVGGCTVKTKESRTFSTSQNSGPTGQAPQCGGNSPYRFSDPRFINPDGTCFVTLKTFGSEDQNWELDPNQAYTKIYGNCQVGSSSTYSWNYYKSCSRYSFGGDSARTPWSVSFTSPAVGNDPPTRESWRDFFEFQSPDSCSFNSNTGKYEIVPSSIAPYCSCEVTEWCDKDGCTQYSDYDCNFPQKAGRSFTPAPPGDYLFELTASGTSSVNYSITAGGAGLASGNAPVSGGKISVKFNVPGSSVGQNIEIKFSQSGGGVESVTFGKPGLYPLGWYEASVDFGRTSTTSLDDAFVVDPPPDYPYTIGMVPPEGNYCPKSSAIDQCYKNLAQAPLNSNDLSRVDFLLGDSKAGPWFQVKDADLQANGNISSNIPAVCKSPQCIPELGLPGLGGYPGIPAFAGKMDLGNGTVSGKGWNALSKYSGRRYDYSFFKSRVPSAKLVNLADRYGPAGDGSITIGPTEVEALAKELGSGGNVGYLLAPGKLVFNGNTDVKDNKIVFFIEGSFEIKGRINLDDDKGFFGAFVKGDISIDSDVSQPQKPSIEGVYMADGIIKTGTKKPGADDQLIIRGMMVGWSGITLERNLDPDRQTGQNDKQPAEFIEYAPDLVLNFPKELLREGSVWREIAP